MVHMFMWCSFTWCSPVRCRFTKYNDLLRKFGPALAGCKDNTYVTTTHVVNSAIVKASKLTTARKIYRGVAGGVLPERFWRANEQGVKGGIESAFMSTTFERKVAMKYAAGAQGKPALVFEMQVPASWPVCCLMSPATGLVSSHPTPAGP